MKKKVTLTESQLKNFIRKILKEDFENEYGDMDAPQSEIQMRHESIKEDFEKAFTLIENIIVSIEKDHDKGVINDDIFNDEIDLFKEELESFVIKLRDSF